MTERASIPTPAIETAVRRLSTRLLIGPGDLPASRPDFEVVGIFNPGAVLCGDEVVLMVRVAERPRQRRPGFTALPRWDPDAGTTVDWVENSNLDFLDQRSVTVKDTAALRLVFISHLRVVRCGDGRAVREICQTAFSPAGVMEEYGVEDPRISFLDGRYYITYVSVSHHGVATSLASTTDFETFERHGVIFCPENKDVALFPERTNGLFTALHRPFGATPYTRPEIWTAQSSDLRSWGAHAPLNLPSTEWGSGRVGGGVPPIRLPQGLLTIYHGSVKTSAPGEVGAYFGGAVLLDATNSTKVLGQLPGPLLAAEADFEVAGLVPNVVFPTGAVQQDDTLLVYYGAADTCTAVAEFSITEIIGAMVAPK